MQIDRFEMERLQNLYESQVEINLSTSGIPALTAMDVLDGNEQVNEFLSYPLSYDDSIGSVQLRQRIASLYTDCNPENVTVTNGTSEANYMTLWTLLDPGKRLACMVPNYLQGWGIGHAYAGGVDAFHLVPCLESGCLRWVLDLDELKQVVTKHTSVILVNTPNNPTGAILSREEMEAVVDVARNVGAWLVVDEVYRGAELEGETSPSFWGMYEKTVSTAGMSKAFSLPGLRIGWVVAPRKLIEELWAHHDYLTLTPGLLSDYLATQALKPEMTKVIQSRLRSILQTNLPYFESWIQSHSGKLSYIRPQAGAIAYFSYQGDQSSVLLAERLRCEQSVLVVPAEYFGLEKGFRIGYGMNVEKMQAGLERLSRLLLD